MTATADAWFRLVTLCLATVGLGGALGELAHARNDPRPRSAQRIGQLWRFVTLVGFIGLVVVTEVVRIGYPANWHTYADGVLSLFSVIGVTYEAARRHRKEPIAHDRARQHSP